MAASKGKLDKLIKATDQLVESKGVSKLAKTFDKSLNIVGNAVSAAADVANHQLDEHRKLHRDDVSVPDIKGLNLVQTQTLFEGLDLQYALVVAEPSKALAQAKADTIVKTVPKANKVLSAGSFVKVYYVDAATISASQALVAKASRRNQIRKDSAKAIAQKVKQGTVSGANSFVQTTTGLSKKVVPHKHSRKQIKAEIIDVPKQNSQSDDYSSAR
ncbi:PASTA domain-containing protein [Lacticaseibacillus jixiensis]|uniref:PASTA domain-containing protein n=1 Tax=Lacticaseibacillus jixiensis TaxID=3231926 RepID=UPI0036F4008C